MQQDKENRVLGRQGARELTREEVARAQGKGYAGGGTVHTNVISFNPITFKFDGDGL